MSVRYTVWTNGVPILLPDGVEPTEEAVNKERARHGLKPLDGTDEDVVVVPVNPSILFDWVKKYPARSP